MSKSLLALLIFNLWTVSTIAGESKVIDLGDLSIEGDVRRPLVLTLQSQDYTKIIQQKILLKEFELLENELLKLAPLGEQNDK